MNDKLTQNFSRKIPKRGRVFEKSKCKWQAVTVASGLTRKTSEISKRRGPTVRSCGNALTQIEISRGRS